MPPYHTDKDITAWQFHPRTKKGARHKKEMLTEQQVKRGVLEGSMPSVAWDTKCTSHAGMVGDPFTETKHMYTKIFALADGHPTTATNIVMMYHKVRELARTVNMAPSLANQYLLSRGKFSEAGYVSVRNGEKINIYDGHTAKITVSKKAVLKGWQCPRTILWRISLQCQVTDINLHTLILNGLTGHEPLNSLYTALSSAEVLDHIEIFNNNPVIMVAEEEIHNVYKLPSI